MIDHVELRAIEQSTIALRIELAPFYKHSTGTVRASTDPADMGKLINLGTLNYYGTDLIARVHVEPPRRGRRRVRLHEAQYTKATTLDRLPHNRAEGWIQVTPEPHISLLARVKYFGTSIDQSEARPATRSSKRPRPRRSRSEYLAVLRCDDLADVRPETRAGYHSAGRRVSAGPPRYVAVRLLVAIVAALACTACGSTTRAARAADDPRAP